MARKKSSATDASTARRQLIEKRSELFDQQRMIRSRITGLPSTIGGSHMSDRSNENDVNDKQLARIGRSLKDVNLKLRRLSGPNYGICQSCNSKIPAARLAAEPGARLCLSCKELEEAGR